MEDDEVTDCPWVHWGHRRGLLPLDRSTTQGHPPTPGIPWPEIPHAQRKRFAAEAAGSCSSARYRGAMLCQQVSKCHPRISGLQAGLAAASTLDLAGSEALGCTSDTWSAPLSALEGACVADPWLQSQRRWERVLLRGPGGWLHLTSTAEGPGSCLVWGWGCGQPGSQCFSVLPQFSLIGAHRPQMIDSTGDSVTHGPGERRASSSPNGHSLSQQWICSGLLIGVSLPIQVPELCSSSQVFCGRRGTAEEDPTNLDAHQACRPHIATNGRL